MEAVFDNTLGLVFTDARARIVFFDSHFLDLAGLPEQSMLVGEPLAKILHVESSKIDEIMREVAQHNTIHDQMLQIATGANEPRRLRVNGIANFDERKMFLGADFTLRPYDASPVAMPVTHGDILLSRAAEIHQQADAAASERDQMLLAWYFTTQITALQVLLGRIGGQRVSETASKIVNTAAQRGGWPIRLTGGQLILSAEQIPMPAYSTVLMDLINYAVVVVGQRVVEQEMALVDAHMTPETINIAYQVGLRRSE
jgi:hypothetical protein